MHVSDPGDPAPAFESEPAYLGLTPIHPAPAPAPAQFDLEYFDSPSVEPSHVAYSPCGPPPIYPVLLSPTPLGHPSCGPPMMGALLPYSQFFAPPPLNFAYTNPNPFMEASFPSEPVEIPEENSGDGLVAYRKFMNWIHTVYYSSKSPDAFVQAWQRALKEMKQASGPPHLPTVFILNQFLAAVSVNPNTVPWVESLQFDKGSLPASILDEAYADFLEFEACRLGGQLLVPGNIDTADSDVDQIYGFPKQYCPYHQRLTKHPVDECFRNPRNTKRKRKWRRRMVQMAAALEAEKGRRL
ncbi:hypothetical protein PEX1_094050 [Penicillium expansum]|uniref:Uncharacterized protein n=1 Tax=Penicillium expansum TaxID=27334 RepID=A0A0A2JY91_PENEN|nr:hypothetical protein PEX2_106160 [Penicillium expansum]KGO40274.1 hypothetical protein PEXP_030890 [Penicillium expansum]KGO49594.1 hypothetical protein PEX2_106160 [Penicillium expansum]KGO59603.1 hypothetical protein PEX1_094050 [Penicillium expansum]